MPTIKTVKCDNCKRLYQITLKRFNESNKFGWNKFCCKKCQSEYKSKQILLTCSNPQCKKTFKRSKASLNTTRNFCSQSCSAKINNSGKVRNPTGTNGKEFNYRSIPIPNRCKNSLCNNIIPNRNKFCSVKCQRSFESKPNEYYLNIIKRFALENGRIPIKRELGSIYGIARKRFGNWNKAIIAAGFEPNPVLFAKKHIAKDGHKCDSLTEKVIDDWMYSNNVPHKTNVPYPLNNINNKLTCDFVVKNVWIEYFGLAGDFKKYDKLVEQKIKIAKKQNLFLIKLYPKHIIPFKKGEKVLKDIFKILNII